MIKNVIVCTCDICGATASVVLPVKEFWEQYFVIPPDEWDYRVSPNDGSSVVLCPECKNKKIVWTPKVND